MATDVDTQDQVIKRGEDAVIPFEPPTPTDISGWTIEFNLAATPGADVVAGCPVAATIVNTTTGAFTISLPATMTAALTAGQTYYWDVWRTNPGVSESLASGTARVKQPVRRP